MTDNIKLLFFTMVRTGKYAEALEILKDKSKLALIKGSDDTFLSNNFFTDIIPANMARVNLIERLFPYRVDNSNHNSFNKERYDWININCKHAWTAINTPNYPGRAMIASYFFADKDDAALFKMFYG